jgi:hypothetical protein
LLDDRVTRAGAADALSVIAQSWPGVVCRVQLQLPMQPQGRKRTMRNFFYFKKKCVMRTHLPSQQNPGETDRHVR